MQICLQFHETFFGVYFGQSEVHRQLDITDSVNISQSHHIIAYIVLGHTVHLITYDLLSVFCECNKIGAVPLVKDNR